MASTKVTLTVRLPNGREIVVEERAKSRRDIVAALNRARDRMVAELAANHLTPEGDR